MLEGRRSQCHYVASANGSAEEPSSQAISLTDAAAAPAGSAVFAVSSLAPNKHCLSLQQARAAFLGYDKQPSYIRVPALQRTFTVSAGWSSGRFRLGDGWPALLAATRMRPGQRVRLSRTGDASFDLVVLGATAMGQDAEQVASGDRQGAPSGAGRSACCTVTVLRDEQSSLHASRLHLVN